MSSIANNIRSIYRIPHFRSLFALEWAMGALIVMALVAPRGAFIYLCALAVVVVGHQLLCPRSGDTRATAADATGSVRDIPESTGAMVVWCGLVVLLIYAAITSYLAEPDLTIWLRKPFQAAAVVVVCWVICRAFSRYDEPVRWHIARGVVHGFLLGLIYLAAEHVSVGGIKAAATNLTGLFPVGANANVVDEGKVVEIGPVFLNRHTVAVAILTWASMLAAMAWLCQFVRLRTAVLAALLIVTTVLAFASLSETSKMAMVAGVVTGLGAAFRPRVTYRMVQFGWVVLVLGIIPLILLALPTDSRIVQALPYSAKDRVVIWHYTINRIEPVPILGYGAASTPLLAAKREKPEGRRLVPRLSRHAHNVYLQTWFELGGLGALLLLTIGLGALASIRQAYAATRPFLLAQFVAIASVALTGYGMWQVWLLSLVALSACIMSCVAHPSATFFVSRPPERRSE